VARSLNVPDADSFTNHAFRRSAVTTLANAGLSSKNLQRFGRWKSEAMADTYIAESAPLKQDTATQLLSSTTSVIAVSSQSSSVIAPRVLDSNAQTSYVFHGCQVIVNHSSGNVFLPSTMPLLGFAKGEAPSTSDAAPPTPAPPLTE
jgi:hypothetical protein